MVARTREIQIPDLDASYHAMAQAEEREAEAAEWIEGIIGDTTDG